MEPKEVEELPQLDVAEVKMTKGPDHLVEEVSILQEQVLLKLTCIAS